MEQKIPSISEQIAEYYVSAEPSAIPQSVISRTKEIILDWMGNAIGGSNLESTELVRKAMLSPNYTGVSTVMGGGTAPAEKAAFVNAFE